MLCPLSVVSAVHEMQKQLQDFNKIKHDGIDGEIDLFDPLVLSIWLNFLRSVPCSRAIEWENRSRKGLVFFFPLFRLALFIQVLRGRFHKFCGGDICFSKAQYRSHTQGSEVWALVFSMQNLSRSKKWAGWQPCSLLLLPAGNHSLIMK